MTVRVLVTSNLLPRLAAEMPRAAERAVRETTEEIATEAKLVVPVRTGNLRASIFATVRGTRGEVATGPQAPYAIYVHDGVRGRPARPFLAEPAHRAIPRFRARVERALRP